MIFSRYFKSLKFFNFNAELLHLDQYPMFSACILQTHIKMYGNDVNIATLSGEVLLPPFKQSIGRKNQLKLLENSAPVMIYNAIYHEDMPASNEIIVLAHKLESNLKEHKENPWIQLLLNAYFNNEVVGKKYLLALPQSQSMQLEISRTSYDELCGELLVEIINCCIKKRAGLFEWMIKNMP